MRPVAVKGTMCPLWRKDVSKVCHTCTWYTPVKGKHPQTEEVLDQWGCAIAWAPMLAINIAQHVNGVQAATESFRNATVTIGKAIVGQNSARVNSERVTHTDEVRRLT